MKITSHRRTGPTLILIAAAIVFGCTAQEEMTEADTQYLQEVAAWRATRIEKLKNPTGWLSLVGLFPLAEGVNSLGSAPDNNCVFPAGAPERVGTVRLEGGRVVFLATPGVPVLHDSSAVDSVELVPDPEPGAVALRVADRFEFLHILRAGQHYLRLKDRQAEALKNFDSIPHHPVNVAWRVEARWEPYDPPRMATIPNILGFDTETPMKGAAVFEWNGATYRLEPDDAADDAYFFVFGDATNGTATYGGGRYMYMDPPDSAGTIILDFNRAYNPPCVFSPYATCPLPRPENVLPFAVEAGELTYKH
jgi:uncharacterized protein (DUF1684 family)